MVQVSDFKHTERLSHFVVRTTRLIAGKACGSKRFYRQKTACAVTSQCLIDIGREMFSTQFVFGEREQHQF